MDIPGSSAKWYRYCWVLCAGPQHGTPGSPRKCQAGSPLRKAAAVAANCISGRLHRCAASLCMAVGIPPTSAMCRECVWRTTPKAAKPTPASEAPFCGSEASFVHTSDCFACPLSQFKSRSAGTESRAQAWLDANVVRGRGARREPRGRRERKAKQVMDRPAGLHSSGARRRLQAKAGTSGLVGSKPGVLLKPGVRYGSLFFHGRTGLGRAGR